MKQIQTIFILAIILLAGLNCSTTENPVGEEKESEAPQTSSTGILRGEVQSIEGVAVQVRLLKAGSVVAQTEVFGSYELAAIEAGAYTLQFSAKGYESKQVDVTVVAGQVVSLESVALEMLEMPVSHLRGHLINAGTGEPIAEVQLQLSDGAGKDYQGLTTGRGVFTFENLPVEQTFTLTIVHEGYENQEVTLQPIPVSTTFELDIELTPLLQAEPLEPGEGLRLGSDAPAFELPDGNGTLHALADYTGEKKVVLIFYRGGW